MTQRQFRDDDTSTWTDRYGNGSDGALTISANITDSPIDSACTGTSGATSLTATNASFAAGQLILIHQTQGTGAGAWELNKISSYVAGTITLAYPLINTYAAGAQVLVLKQYSSVTVSGGVTLTAKAWNGTTGGILGLLCNGTITVTGNISANYTGYRGGNPTTAGAGAAYQGESGSGVGVQSQSNNGAGGGGGYASDNSGGGGGGYGTAGTAGNAYPGGAGTGGFAGTTAGVANLTTIFFGGAGGGGHSNSSSGSVVGQNGGSLVLLIGKTITVTGGITSNGHDAVASSSFNGDGAAGSGGPILVKGQTITLGTTLVTATGGARTNDATSGAGGGGVGRIHIDYASTAPSGTTNPTLDSAQQTVLADLSGGLWYAQI